jgi:hypothetical protein
MDVRIVAALSRSHVVPMVCRFYGSLISEKKKTVMLVNTGQDGCTSAWDECNISLHQTRLCKSTWDECYVSLHVPLIIVTLHGTIVI